MMQNKERYQNPAISDRLKLRLFTYNSNNLANLKHIESVSIYFLDPHERSEENPDGRRLVQTINGTEVLSNGTGDYSLEFSLDELKYTIGRYVDVWTVSFSSDESDACVEQCFEVYPNLWYTTPIPIVHDFQFMFQPNKFRQGSKQFMIIEICPNVPTANDLRAYYENIAIVSDLKISIELNCGECVPEEQDLRMIVDKEKVDFREKRHGFYHLDTSELECGIYDVWFQLDVGGNCYISDRNHFQIYN